MTDRRIAEAFPPGEFIKEELEARDWSQVELAEIIGREPKVVSDLVRGKRAVTPEIAKALGDAFGTSAQFWMNLQSSYELWRAKDADDAIARRARLYALAPIKEMVKRHWLEMSESVAVLEERVRRFFSIQTLDEPIHFPHAARRGTKEITPSQEAWLFRARQLAHAAPASPFSARSFNNGLNELKGLLHSAQEVRHVPRVLAEAGIRFLVLEHLPQTRIDGVAFWLDDRSPVIVVSLRYKRIDWFWYTLCHELCHVARRDGLRHDVMLDTDIVGNEVESVADEAEREADHFATAFLVSPSDLDDFIQRTRPLYGRQKIIGFASRIGVHPGIVVGQLQFRGEVPWSAHRQLLEEVRPIVIGSALTDGWDQGAPALNRGWEQPVPTLD
ncbi:MAG TPA: HigA family addiction module antitoxin [Armatimonadota bacterium]|nr:HigA family addiction module antitoxin [Armatimonadota bacterium]